MPQTIGINIGLQGVTAVEQGARRVSNAIGSIGSSAQRAYAVMSGALAGVGLVGVMSKIASNTIAAEREQTALAAALQATGHAAGYSQQRLSEMAEAMAGATSFSTGEFARAQKVLTGFTNLVGEQFPKALKVAADYAAYTGTSLASAAEVMGRALDVPSVGMVNLQRVGFKFSESQIEAARSLERTGRVAEAQQLVLDALTQTYGGAAEAARGTFGGAIDALKNSVNDLLTGKGGLDSARTSIEALTQTLASSETRAAFGAIVSWVTDFTNAVITATANIAAFIGANNKLALITRTDSFSKMKAEAQAASDNVSRLTDQLERYQEALSRDPSNVTLQRAADKTRQMIDTEMRRAMSLSQELKQWASAADEKTKQVHADLITAPDLAVKAPGAINLKDLSGGSSKAQIDKDYEAAQRYLKSLEQQAFKTQERTAYEQLYFDIQNKELTLTDKQLGRAQGLATVIDMAREAEKQRAAEIDRQNTAFELQNRLMQQQSGYQIALSGYGEGDKAAQDMRERTQLLQQQQSTLMRLTQEHAQELRRAETEEQRTHLQALFADRLAATRDEQAQELRNFDEYLRLRTAKERDGTLGMVSAIRTWVENAQDAYTQMRNAAQSALTGMEDALVSFATTGKASFGELARSIIADLIRIQIRANATGIMGKLIDMLSPSKVVSLDWNAIPNAQGGVYSSPSLAQYRNQVHDSPKFFTFARGGVFGEAGAEAIMPLTRGADGNLGVRASGGGVVVNIHNYAGAQVEQKTSKDSDGRQILDVFVRQAVATVADQLVSDSGPVGQAMRGRDRLRMA